MDKVVEEPETPAPNGGYGPTKMFFADASAEDANFDGIVKKFIGLHIRLVVNNVGGLSPKTTTSVTVMYLFLQLTVFSIRFEGRKANLRLDILFTTPKFFRLFTSLFQVKLICFIVFTRALIPGLRKSSRQRSVLIVSLVHTRPQPLCPAL